MVDAGRRTEWAAVARSCRRAGVTGIELGFPFSDPIADGPVLQTAAARALSNGTDWGDLLQALRVVSRELPTAVMTYANPVFHHGLAKASRQVAAEGGSGFIIPDLALEESGPWRRAAHRAGLLLVQMGSPATPVSRVAALAKASSGFFYLVSRYGTTGRGSRTPARGLRPIVSRVHSVRPELPVLIGFGVRTPADIGPLRATGADGVIVGSAVEQRLTRSRRPGDLEHFLRPLVQAAVPLLFRL
jgi:tryptophan synthase alpha chain